MNVLVISVAEELVEKLFRTMGDFTYPISEHLGEPWPQLSHVFN